ncbi:MAG TPA: efflux RND transporter periplasmic adaptor subunit, partial [Rhizomicrobium sp.]|nr:efflux RND transporter periplasmic adaptor subunit [Rhizomicrobium sp.]
VMSWLQRGHKAVVDRVPSGAARFLSLRMFLMLLITGGILALVFAIIAVKSSFSGGMAGGPPAQVVSTVRAQPESWQPQLRAVGTLHAFQGADLAFEVTGLVTGIGFQAGQDVRAGALLVQLRDDADRAQLAALRASAVLAQQTYARDAALIKSNAIAKADYDSALANLNNIRAQIDEQQAVVDKKAIRAPYDGRIGIRQVDVGQYVNAGQVVVTLEQLDPIYVDFQVPQQELSALSAGAKVTVTTDAVGGATFDGTIAAFDPKVDPDTRNVHVRAAVHNPGGRLLPGMFATVIVAHGAPQTPITLPQTAIVFSPYGDTVFVVTKAKDAKGSDTLIAQQRFVTLGDARGDQVAILSGLKPDEDVVSAGQIKLKNGSPVTIDNSIRVPNDAAPKPQDQ